MAIKIQTKTPGIPIEIGKLKFEFDTTDESIQSFYKNADMVQKEMEEINPAEGKEIESSRVVLEKGFDYMLGEGSFEKIYEQTPSIMLLMGYYVDLAESLTEELKSMGLTQSQKQKVEKYLKNKNKK